ncbi:MAG: hypothetical protein AB1635_17945 [Acidobacteriota bacterium]
MGAERFPNTVFVPAADTTVTVGAPAPLAVRVIGGGGPAGA